MAGRNSRAYIKGTLDFKESLDKILGYDNMGMMDVKLCHFGDRMGVHHLVYNNVFIKGVFRLE